MDNDNALTFLQWHRDEAFYNDGLACAVSLPGSLIEDYYCFSEQQFTCTRDCSMPKSRLKLNVWTSTNRLF